MLASPGQLCEFLRMVAHFTGPYCEYVLQLTPSDTLFSSRSLRNSLHSVCTVGALLSGATARWLKVGHFVGATMAHGKLSHLIRGESGVCSSPSVSFHSAVLISSLSLSHSLSFSLSHKAEEGTESLPSKRYLSGNERTVLPSCKHQSLQIILLHTSSLANLEG